MTNNIKTLRVKSGLTQIELSELTGICQSKLSKYERIADLSNITLGTLAKIAEVLNVTVNDLIYKAK